jgi:diacylglycerol kinase family enzyme
MRIGLIYNPTSGDERHDLASLVRRLEGAGHMVRDRSIKDDGWRRLLVEPVEPVELVVAAGGDGTVRKVFKEAPTGAPVTVLPLGSANNIARTLGLADADVDRLIEGLDGGRRTGFDIGRVEAPSGDTTFVESFGGGVFAEVLQRAKGLDADGQAQLDAGLRLLIAAFAESPAHEWCVDVDGRDVSGAFLAVELMNVKETGPNVPLARDADPGDERLDVVGIGEDVRPAILDYLERRLRGEEAKAPTLPAICGRRVRLRPPDGSPLRVDDQLFAGSGSQGTAAVITVTAAARTLSLILPAT